MQTPQKMQKKLAKAIGLAVPLYFKREDLHPLGSHKGRSMPIMINEYRRGGWKNFCISSSGNAALAAARYIKNINRELRNKISLQIFVGENIDDKKFKILRRLAADKNIGLTQVENPKQAAFQTDTRNEAKNLRQSTDDMALKGYVSLANELAKIKNLSAVFIPTSSGTAAQGLYEAFKKLKINPEIHIVQTVACHPIAKAVMVETVSSPLSAPTSIASAIVDKIAHRKTEVAEAVKKSQGAGWVPDDEEIKSAMKLVKINSGISISSSSALSVAGLIEAINNNWIFNGPVVCLITGA